MIHTKYLYLVIQMTEIYFSCVFDLCPWFLAHSSPDPWDFLSIESDVSCHVNEVTFGKHLKGKRLVASGVNL